MGLFDKMKDIFVKDDSPDTTAKDRGDLREPVRPDKQEISPLVKWITDQKNAGKSDDEIITALKAAGHTPESIHKAMRQADVALGVEPMPEVLFPEPKKVRIDLPDRKEPAFAQNVEPYAPSKERAEIENLIETRIQKVQEQIAGLTNWRGDIEAEVDKMSAAIEQLSSLLKESRDKERAKFTEYDKHLSEVKIELKATQEVFKKGLPQFTKGIQELTRIVKRKKE